MNYNLMTLFAVGLGLLSATFAQDGGKLFASEVVMAHNPYKLAPLTAEATFRTTKASRITVVIAGKAPVKHTFAGYRYSHTLPILGLYPGQENQVTLRAETRSGEVDETSVTLLAPALPQFFPTIKISQRAASRMEPGWNLSAYTVNRKSVDPQSEAPVTELRSVLEGYPFIFDNTGQIRYYLDISHIAGVVYEFGRLKNGNWLFAYDDKVYEYSLLGKRLNTWTLRGYKASHDIFEKPNGNFLIAAYNLDGSRNKGGAVTEGDHVIELGRNTGKIIKVWDLRNVLDVYRRDFVDNPADWFHMNAVWFDARDGGLVISGRNQGIIKVSKDNELEWIIAPHKGWGKAGLKQDGLDTRDYLLTAIDANGRPYSQQVQDGYDAPPGFDWPWGQHATMVLDNGNILYFNNGWNRDWDKNPSKDVVQYSQGVEYQVNTANKTVQEVWEYGRQRQKPYYSRIISDVDALPQTGNRLIMPGIVQQKDSAGAFITEVSYPDNALVFEAHIRYKGLFRSENFWGEITYRSERLPLYPAIP